MPQSNLPPAARRQVKEANRQIKAIQDGQDPSKPAAPPPVALTPVPGTPPAGQAQLQPVIDFPVVGSPVPADATPVAPAAPAPASEPPADATPMAAPNDADHKYKVLQGKYNAEQRRNNAEIQSLRDQNATLIQRLGAPAPAPVATPVPQTTEERAAALGISKQELAEYGPELVEMIMRVAGNITAPELRRLAAEQQRLQGAVSQTVQHVQRTARELVYDALETHIPSWETVNDSQTFLDWLAENDIFSGQTRQAGLMKAFENNDATRVVSIFRAFLAEDERSRPTARTRQVDPATLVAPGQPTGSGTPAPKDSEQSGKIWLESEVGDFYSLVRRGRISKADKDRIEAEINLALVEGRIRPAHNDQNLANAR